MNKSYDHFKGKSTYEHLVDARKKGSHATEEAHGAEPSGSLIGGCDAAKEAAIYFSLLWMLLSLCKVPSFQVYGVLALFGVGFLIWKCCRSAMLGWTRLDRLHRLIEEERWEITHNRAQEKEELREMYAVKGFKGKLLDEIVEVLMADDERLLRVMLEEELGLSLESFEHPLKQALGTLFGALLGIILCFIGILAFKFTGLLVSVFVTVLVAATLSSKAFKGHLIQDVVWSLSTSYLTIGVSYFLIRFIESKVR